MPLKLRPPALVTCPIYVCLPVVVMQRPLLLLKLFQNTVYFLVSSKGYGFRLWPGPSVKVYFPASFSVWNARRYCYKISHLAFWCRQNQISGKCLTPIRSLLQAYCYVTSILSLPRYNVLLEPQSVQNVHVFKSYRYELTIKYNILNLKILLYRSAEVTIE